MKAKQILWMLMVTILAMTAVSGCGKPKTASSEGTNIVQKSEPQEGDDSASKNYEVQLDTRTKRTMYQYGMDDLSFVDTVTGEKVTVGMTAEEIEAVTGASLSDDKNYRIYDGLIVQYDNDGRAAALVVSGGLFQSEAQGTRFMASRGVGLKTSREDFIKAYGDLYTEGHTETDASGETVIKRLSNAMRYFMVDGDTVEYLGSELTEEMKEKYAGKLYMQDFMFEHEENRVTSMRVINVDYIGK